MNTSVRFVAKLSNCLIVNDMRKHITFDLWANHITARMVNQTQ